MLVPETQARCCRILAQVVSCAAVTGKGLTLSDRGTALRAARIAFSGIQEPSFPSHGTLHVATGVPSLSPRRKGRTERVIPARARASTLPQQNGPRST